MIIVCKRRTNAATEWPSRDGRKRVLHLRPRLRGRKARAKQAFHEVRRPPLRPRIARSSVVLAQMTAGSRERSAISVTPEDHFVALFGWIRKRRRGSGVDGDA